MPIERLPGQGLPRELASPTEKELNRIARGHAGRREKVKLLEQRQREAAELYYREEHDPEVIVNNVAPTLTEKSALAEWYWKRAWAIGQLAVRDKRYGDALAALRQMREIAVGQIGAAADQPLPAMPYDPLAPKPKVDRAIRDLDEAQAEGEEILARFQAESYRQKREE